MSNSVSDCDAIRDDVRRGASVARRPIRKRLITLVCLVVISLTVFCAVARFAFRSWFRLSLVQRQFAMACAINAVECYAVYYRKMPLPASLGASGEKIGSWRMAVSGFLRIAPPVDSRFAWYDEANRSATDTSWFPFCFITRGEHSNETCVVAVTGRDTAFEAGLPFFDMPRDLILLVEIAPCGFEWTSPYDVDLDHFPEGFTQGFDGQGLFVGFLDNSVWYLDKSVPVDLIRQFCTTKGASELDREVCLKPFKRFGFTRGSPNGQ
jgi:hypothetical protein